MENPIIEKENKENIDSQQPVDDEFVKRIMNSTVFKFLSTGTADKITLATTVVALGSFFIRVLAYLKLKGYLSVFSMSVNHVDFSANQGFSEFLLYAVFFMGLVIGTAVVYLLVDHLWFSHRLRKAANSVLKQSVWKRFGRIIRDTISFVPVLVVTIALQIWFNFLLCLLIQSPEVISKSGFKDWILLIGFLMASETVVAFVMVASDTKKKRKVKSKEDKEQDEKEQAIEQLAKRIVRASKRKPPMVLDWAMSFISIAVFLYSAMAYCGGILEAKQTKHFSIVEEQYAIIYQSSETFWTVACAEDDGILTLDTSKQKIMSSNDIEIQKKTFSEVVINYK